LPLASRRSLTLGFSSAERADRVLVRYDVAAHYMASADDTYHELYVYTMTHGGGEAFILQHVVDAFAAQTATADTKPIKLIFALVGLYLHVEHQFSGRHVQRVHMGLAEHKPQWPTLRLPSDRGAMTLDEVMAAEEGSERDAAIDAWCRSVWEAFHESREAIIGLLRLRGIV
jgi:hypothetical protein